MNKQYFTLIISNLIIILWCLILPEEIIIKYGHLVYLIQFLCISILLLKLPNNTIYIFSPSFITLCYLCLSFWGGHYVVSRGILFDLRYYHIFHSVKSIKFITIFLLFSNFIVVLSIPFKQLKLLSFSPNNIDDLNFPKQPIKIIFILLIFIFILSLVNIDLSAIGGSANNDFSYVFQLALAIYIVILASPLDNKIKYIVYCSMLLLFIIEHYNDKRNILFLVILITFYESIINKIIFRIKFKLIILGLLGAGLIFYIVLVASISRGYGNFDIEKPFDSFKYVSQYLKQENIQKALVANFELATVYGNSANAINYVYTNEVNLLYGTTFLKVLFIPIPRNIFPDKPSSMVHIYTSKFAPQFRTIGGSYPIIIYAETYWNFGILCFVFIYLLFYLLNNLYLKILYGINNKNYNGLIIFLIYMYITFIQFVRGSGVELWLIFGLLALPLIILINFIINKKFNINSISLENS